MSSKNSFISVIQIFKVKLLYNIDYTQIEIFKALISFHFDDYDLEVMKTTFRKSENLNIRYKSSMHTQYLVGAPFA